MIQQQERSGDYGSAAGNTTSADEISSSPSTGGYDLIQRSRLGEANNRIPIMVGAILIVALIFLCFRLAYDGISQSGTAKRITGKAYLEENPAASSTRYRGPAAPAIASNLPPTIPVQPNIARPDPIGKLPPPPVIMTTPILPQQRLFESETAQREAITQLSDCRIAYNLSGELSKKWYEAVARVTANKPENKAVYTINATEKAAAQDENAPEQPSSAVPMPAPTPAYLSTDEWNTIDTQMEAIAGTVGISTQPLSYPPALQESSAGLGREMRIYLETTRIALTEMDSDRRDTLRNRAEAHRQKAGQFLGRLESAAKSGTAPPSVIREEN